MIDKFYTESSVSLFVFTKLVNRGRCKILNAAFHSIFMTQLLLTVSLIYNSIKMNNI